MAVPSPTKARLREELKARRAAHVAGLSVAERCATGYALAGLAMPLLEGARTVAVYLPIGAEIDPLALIDALASRGTALALPYYGGPLAAPRFLAWQPGDALHPGPIGLRQPAKSAAVLTPDVFITPLLGFDPQRNRLGYGAGFYDKAFAATSQARRIGVAWACQQVETLPVETWDMPLHAVVTENEVLT